MHEVMYVPAVERYAKGQIAKDRLIKLDDFMAHMKADHTAVETVGRIAQEACVKTLVLSRLAPAIDNLNDGTGGRRPLNSSRARLSPGKI